MRYIINDKVKVAQSENETFVMLGGQYYVLNETAWLTWQQFSKGATEEEVMEELMKNYASEIDKETIRMDYEELMSLLLEHQMLIEG